MAATVPLSAKLGGAWKRMRPYLTDLLERMSRKDPIVPGVSSAKSVSWAATREAEKLGDISLVDELAAAVAAERSRNRRQNSYFIIGKIGLNAADASCAARLLGFFAFEKDKYCLARILESVGEIPKPTAFDYSPITPWLEDERWLVRHSAIRAFDNSRDPAAEECVLRHLAQTEDPFDQAYCHAVLNRIGTPHALPLIERSLKSRKRDVRMSAELAILAIRRRHGSNSPSASVAASRSKAVNERDDP